MSELPELASEVENLYHGGDGPGEDVQQVQRRNGVEVGKNRVNPDDPKNTGAQDYHNGRHGSFSNSSGSSERTVHKGAYRIGKAHNAQPFHTAVNDSLLGGKQRQELPSENQQKSA